MTFSYPVLASSNVFIQRTTSVQLKIANEHHVCESMLLPKFDMVLESA